MPDAACEDDSIRCSLTRIADSLTADWSWVDWLVTVGLPIAGIAASVLIGVASIRLTRAANRLNERATSAEAAKQAKEARSVFVDALLDWVDALWSEPDADTRQERAETVTRTSLKMKAAVLAETGIDSAAAKSVSDAVVRARAVLEAMPPLERTVASKAVKENVQTLATAFLALPDGLPASMRIFDSHIHKMREAAENNAVRARLRADLARREGTEKLSSEKIEAMLDALEDEIAGSGE